MSIITVAYCQLVDMLCLMQPYDQLDPDTPFSMAFKDVGMNWANLEGYELGIARQRHRPGQVPDPHRPHSHDTAMAGSCERKDWETDQRHNHYAIETALIAFFTDLDILYNLLSFSTLFIFMLVAVALLVR
uniref:Uncharacterized protein n=1 Tax=Nelumbo nucifera TaxID=4432 RepID=A0A822Z6Q9_NELNU|nr:TPA_asm: hypothetical protein HUJ06_007879 [Nelumbo nucifera]